MDEHQMPMRHSVSLSKRTLNMGHKVPYVDVISNAILASPQRRLTAKEIFEQVSIKYGPMKKAETLKNTIRHTLSRYKVFRKVQRGRQKKPNWWTVDEDVVYALNTNQTGPAGLDWRPESALSVGHPAPQQVTAPTTTVVAAGGQAYLPTTKSFPFYGNAQFGQIQTPEYKSTPIFKNNVNVNPKLGHGCSTFAQLDATPIPARVVGGSTYQQLAGHHATRGGHYVITAEDFAVAALPVTTAAFLPPISVQSSMLIN